jgi:hypothetical protein
MISNQSTGVNPTTGGVVVPEAVPATTTSADSQNATQRPHAKDIASKALPSTAAAESDNSGMDSEEDEGQRSHVKPAGLAVAAPSDPESDSDDSVMASSSLPYPFEAVKKFTPSQTHDQNDYNYPSKEATTSSTLSQEEEELNQNNKRVISLTAQW